MSKIFRAVPPCLLALMLWGAMPTAWAACTVRVKPGADLQKAIDALPANGKPATLCLAAGQYPLQGLLSIDRSRLTVRGAGADTVLQMQAGVMQPMLVIGDARNEIPDHVTSDVTVENMSLIGTAGDHEFMPERPWLSNSNIVVRRGEQITLRGLTVKTCRSACVLTERDTHDATISGNHISGAVWDGVSFNRSSQIHLLDNDISGNTAAGITTEHLTGSEIRRNTIHDNGSHGIYLSDSLDNQFTDNTISGNRQAAVFLTCSIRDHDPQHVLCWDNSMSQGNLFEHNHLQHNQFGYSAGADSAANCAQPGWRPNIWRDNDSDAPNHDPDPQRFGTCTRPQ
ncbi:right-handed parallel beta-helix repeat-containing protein [Solimonas marina]|uniref:right-handed parallel beta-helix repeat-containing protein n=1 Tax=Solimonas marina TaxID=2714601 RepID=UPI0034501831